MHRLFLAWLKHNRFLAELLGTLTLVRWLPFHLECLTVGDFKDATKADFSKPWVAEVIHIDLTERLPDTHVVLRFQTIGKDVHKLLIVYAPDDGALLGEGV